MRKKHLLLACNFLIYWLINSTTGVFAQQPAFPGAQGAGMFATGGRGTSSVPTTVFEVTNLNDDGLPGSLRYALSTSATYRTVVFRVSGTIHLNSKLSIRANTTIAGQTAPGDGICVADHPVSISGDNVIVRYMRFRMGDKNQKKLDANGNPVDGSGGDDAFGALGSNNVIIDHCSISWSSDEAMTIYRGDNLTIQWCLVSEPLNYSYHWETGDTDYENHGYGGIWGGKRASMHHNLVAHCRNRTPRFAGVSTYTPSVNGIENVDFRNNVIYNWGINNVYGGEGGNYNVVNNYYKWGPNTGNGVKYRICNPSFNATNGYGKWFVEGNYVDGSPTNTSSNWSGVAVQGGTADIPLAKASTPFDIGYPLSNQSALDAYEAVLNGAGCTLPGRDTLDERIANDVRNRTGRIIDVQGGYPHGTAYSLTVNAWPFLNSLAPRADTDHDGMPDTYESSNGLNPGDASDRNTIASNGYTNLENYLHSLTNQQESNDPVIYGDATFSSFSQSLGSPSAAQSFQISGTNLTNDIVITAPVNYQISSNGTSWVSSITLAPVSGRVPNTSLSVRLNANANGISGGVIACSSNGAATINLAVTGSTTDPVPVVIKQKQIIGIYPAMEGGFENQPAGTVSTLVPTGAANPSPEGWTTSGSANIMSDGNARTGKNYFTYTSTSTSTKNNYSPAVTSSLFSRGTKYIVQYYYRAPAPSTGNAVSGLLAATDNTGTTNFTTGYSTITWTGTNGAWQKAALSYTLNNSYTPKTVFAGLRFNGGGTAIAKPFDVDDFVVYPADNQASPSADVSAPDMALAPAATGSDNFIDLGWSAPSTGLDGGGYIVVRSTSATAPILNPNGIYSIGNSIGTDNVVVYLGSNASFTDNGNVAPLAPGITYFYHIFTADKAFNYSPAVTVSGSTTSTSPVVSVTGTLNPFLQTLGTPSASQSFNVQGNNLDGVANITAPAGFELSDDEQTWRSSLALQPENKSLNQAAFVRLNTNAPGSYSGNITVSSSGTPTASLAVSGNTNNPVPAGYDAVVAADGSGNYTNIQAAVNAAPSGRTAPYKILIRKGRYWGKVIIPSTKPFLQLIGEDPATTFIAFGDGLGGTSTVNVQANDCMLMNLTLENTQGALSDGPQSLAIKTDGDRIVLKNCRFISGQDTVFVNGSGKRVYFKDCYIDGNVDFIYGAAVAVFDSCIIYGRDRVDNGPGGVITAANTPKDQPYGLVFRNCILPDNNGYTRYTLGRPWQNSTGEVAQGTNAYNKTVFLNSVMSSSISPSGWGVWDAGTNTAAITYAEYNSRKFDGSLVDISQRVSWSKQLTEAEATSYYVNSNIFGTWDPYSVWAELAHKTERSIALANFRGIRSSSGTILPFNICWSIPDVKYELYRSTDSITFVKTNEFVSSNDSTSAFKFIDALPPSGLSYYYKVIASKAGYASYTTDTIIKINTSIPLNGDCRSAGSGGWTNNVSAISNIAKGSVTSVTVTASNTGYTTPPSVSFTAAPAGGTTATGTAILTNGIVTGVTITNPGSGYTSIPSVSFTASGYNSVWERYNSTTKNWEALPLGTGASGNVTIRSGDTISLNALVSCNSLTVEKGGAFQADGQNRNIRLKGDISNSGVFGGTNTSQNRITVEFDGLSGIYNINGEGLYNFLTVRPLTGVQDLTININADLTLAGNLQAWYGSGSATNYGDNNVTLNINKGYTVKAGVLHSSNTTNTAASFGNYTYNVNGTLDLSASTILSGLIPHATASTKTITLNVNGVLKTGTQFRTVSTSPGKLEGKVVLKIGADGLVDASKANNVFAVTPNRFIVSGNGALKRSVGPGVVNFPITTLSSTDNPVFLSNTGAVDNFTVNVKDTFDYPVSDSTKAVRKQWRISEDVAGESILTAKFGWTAADSGSKFYLAQPTAVMQYKEGSWLNTPASVAGNGTPGDPYTASVSGLTSLSAFGVINYSRAAANIKFNEATYIYNGSQQIVSGYAYGSAGLDEVLTPSLSFIYRDSAGNVLSGAPVNAGKYQVIASYPGNAYYEPASDSTFMTISSKQLIITANDQVKECGSEIDLGKTGFTALGLLAVDSITSVDLAMGEARAEKGLYSILPSNAQGSGLSNYILIYKTGILTLNDSTKPVPDFAQLPVISSECSVAVTPPTATDVCAGKLVATTTDPLTYTLQGSYTIRWTYDDGNGNTISQNQDVIVKDLSAPVITHNPEVPVQCYNASGTYSIPSLIALDSCGTVNISYSITGATSRAGNGADASGNFSPGLSIIHWSVNDGHGNQTTSETSVQINQALSLSIPDVYAVDSQKDAKNTLYLGYGPTALTINATPSGGTPPYTYAWNDQSSSASLEVRSAGLYTVQITDAVGCSASASISISLVDVRCGNNDDKVKICHNGREICISRDAVQNHLNHGDVLGSCNAIYASNSTITGNTALNLEQAPTVGSDWVLVYPNPVLSELQISLSQLQPGAAVQVYNSTGLLMSSIALNKSVETIPMQSYIPGVYILVIKNGNEVTTKKVIKQ